jgi:hypothetical protein
MIGLVLSYWHWKTKCFWLGLALQSIHSRSCPALSSTVPRCPALSRAVLHCPALSWISRVILHCQAHAQWLARLHREVLRSIVRSQCGVTPACHKPHKKTCYSLKQAYQLFPLSICLFSHWTIPGSCVSNITMLQGSCFSVRNYLCADKIRR